MSKEIYIHYGQNEFQKEKFKPIKNEFHFPKPKGGLWASNICSNFGWKDWCEDEGFLSGKEHEDYWSSSFCFTFKEDANVYHIWRKDDIKNLPLLEKAEFSYYDKYYIDFEDCLARGIDAIELHLYADNGKHSHVELYWALYGWDCNSVIVLNPDCIEVIKN